MGLTREQQESRAIARKARYAARDRFQRERLGTAFPGTQ